MEQKGYTAEEVDAYTSGLVTQMRKGFLSYCMLRVCSGGPKYTSEIIAALHKAELVVVEGTMYPLLSRLQKDGLLSYEWQESEQGPPRKYYQITPFGAAVAKHTGEEITKLTTTLKKL